MGRTRESHDAPVTRRPNGWKSSLWWVAWLLLVALLYFGMKANIGTRPRQYHINPDIPLDAQGDALANDRLSFHGYDCSLDCSGHEAGYEWAKNRGIDRDADCPDSTTSFFEGCLAFIEEGSGPY